MSCFVLSDDYGCTEALWLWKWLYTMSCLVQEPEENVNIINNYIQITHKSTYLKTYLKKEIWSKKNGSFSSTQAPHQQFPIFWASELGPDLNRATFVGGKSWGKKRSGARNKKNNDRTCGNFMIQNIIYRISSPSALWINNST